MNRGTAQAAGKKIFFQSLGCPKNLVDSEVMLGITTQSGNEVVTTADEAEVIIVNTCSFIEASKRESIETILELSQLKTEGKCERLIVAGCLPQRYKADLMVSFPEVDAFLGTGQYQNILDFISGKKEEVVDFKHPRYIHSEHSPRINSQPFYRAYLKISEGCIKNCSFCIIPKIRGTLRSRTLPSLRAEAENLVSQGVKELNLIGQDLTDYGRDLRDSTNLAGLLKELIQIEGLSWIRLFYVYPDELSDELIDLMASEQKICSYLDMPIQHISDRVLGLMNRKVTGSLIRERISRLRKKIPGLSLRSTALVGFPSETESDFNELKAFVTETEFNHLGVFAYSHEEGTSSYSLPHHLPEKIKIERRDEILQLQKDISGKILSRAVGNDLEVLVENQVKEGLFQGRHEGQAPDIDGTVLIEAESLPIGQFQTVKVQQSFEYDLLGSV